MVRIHARQKSSIRARLLAILNFQKGTRKMLLSGCYLVLRFYRALVSTCADKSAYFAGHDQTADSQSAGLPPLKRRTKKVNWIPLPDPLTGPRRSSDTPLLIGFSDDATGQIESISYNFAFDTRITRVPPFRPPPTPACKRVRAACLTARIPLLRRAVSTPRNNMHTCLLGNFGRVIVEL